MSSCVLSANGADQAGVILAGRRFSLHSVASTRRSRTRSDLTSSASLTTFRASSSLPVQKHVTGIFEVTNLPTTATCSLAHLSPIAHKRRCPNETMATGCYDQRHEHRCRHSVGISCTERRRLKIAATPQWGAIESFKTRSTTSGPTPSSAKSITVAARPSPTKHGQSASPVLPRTIHRLNAKRLTNWF
jgi:hypothetical protein